MRPHPLRIAHRGMPRQFRENTLASFAAALAAGADGIELDVHATRDGVVVVHHDPVTATGFELCRENWNAISSSGLDASLSIPTLDEVCRLVDGRAELFVEIKGAGIEEPVATVLGEYRGAASIHSFDHELIGRLARGNAPQQLGLLVDDEPSDTRALLEHYGARVLWPHHEWVTREFVAKTHSFGARVIPWTVNAADRCRELAAHGVDGICTDDVTLLARD